MKSKILTLIFLGLFSGTLFSQIVDEIPRQVAGVWLALVDQGKYEESWKTSSPLFRNAIKQDDWSSKIKESRDSLGALKHREFVKGRFLRDPNGLPKGEYFELEYESEFEKKKIIEVVVPMRDEAGLWQVSLYSISTPDPKTDP